MTGVTDAGSARRLLAGPAVLRTFALTLLGRLAYGVLPLCFLFTVRDATGSFTVAAAASATLGFATLAMPVQARLVDRHGQRQVLPVYAGCYVVVLLLAVVLAHEVSHPAAWIGVGLLVGLTCPALGPAMRAQWREIAAEGAQRRRAYSLDSVGEESLYLVGPVVAAAVLALGRAWVGLLVVAALVVIGTTALVTSRWRPATTAPTTPAAATSGARGSGSLRRLRGLVGPLFLFGAGTACAFVGIASLADRAGTPGAAGLVEAAMAAGAVAGGLLWARFGATVPSRRVLAGLLGYVAAAQALTGGLSGHLALVGAALAVGALGAAPVFVVGFSTADSLVAADRRTEASTWVTVVINAGISGGTAVAGLVAGLGPAAPFFLAAFLSASAAALAGARVTQQRGGSGTASVPRSPR